VLEAMNLILSGSVVFGIKCLRWEELVMLLARVESGSATVCCLRAAMAPHL
jgi:hypothetical protein